MISETTKRLFGRLPREIALHRKVIYTLKELEKYIQLNSGFEDCYTSVYPSNFLIDKIVYDNDFGDFLLQDSKKLFEYCYEKKNYPTIPDVSGNGVRTHIYVLTKPRIYGKEAKLFLTKATYSILEDVFGPMKQITTTLKGKYSRVLRNKDRIIAPDPAVCGDIKRLIRIPETLRPNHPNFCTYLPPTKFLRMTETDIIKHMKHPHHYDYDIDLSNAPSLDEFEYDFKSIKFKDAGPLTTGGEVLTSNPNLFLKGLLRPCLYNRVISIHPDHWSRAFAAIELFNQNYNENQIIEIFSQLGWQDFNEQTTRKQVKSCKDYMPVSCTKLRNYGIPVYGCPPCRG